MAYSLTTPEPSIKINLDQDLLADAEEGSISFWEKDLALLRACVANSKAYNEKKRLREDAVLLVTFKLNEIVFVVYVLNVYG